MDRRWRYPPIFKNMEWRGCDVITIIDDRIQEEPERFSVLGELGQSGLTQTVNVILYDNDG